MQHHDFARSRSGLMLPRARPRIWSLSPKERRALQQQREKLWAGAPQQALLMLGSGAATNQYAASLYAARSCYWEFEENDATSTFINSVTPGTYDLTVRKTSGSDTTSAQSATNGIVGRRYFPNNVNQNCCYIPTASGFRFPNSDHSFGLWCISAAPSGSTRFLMGDIGSAGTTFAALLRINSSDSEFHYAVTSNGSAETDNDSAYGASTSTWSLVIACFDRANNQTILKVRRVGLSLTSTTAAFSSALYTGASSANFCINHGLSSDTTYFSGSRFAAPSIDQAFYFTKVVSDDEFDYLYNSGNGRSWATLKSDAGY